MKIVDLVNTLCCYEMVRIMTTGCDCLFYGQCGAIAFQNPECLEMEIAGMYLEDANPNQIALAVCVK